MTSKHFAVGATPRRESAAPRRRVKSHAPSRRPRRRALPRAETLEDRTVPATLYWVGDVDAFWTSSVAGDTNWSGDVLPADGDTLIFPAGPARTESTNDFSTRISFQSITIEGDGYDIDGNVIGLTDRLTVTAGTATFALNTDLMQDATIEVATGATLDHAGSISGGYGVTKEGGGTLRYSGASPNTYFTGTQVNAGTLILAKSNGVIASNGDVIVGDHTTAATLAAEGDYQFWVGATVTVNEGSTFDVGSSTQDISVLTLQGGSVLIDDGGTLLLFSQLNSLAASNSLPSCIVGLGSLGRSGSQLNATIADDPDLDVDLSVGVAMTGVGPLYVAGDGTLALSGTNTFLGGVDISSGTLIVSGGSALDDDTAVSVAAGAILRVADSEVVGSISGAGTIVLDDATLSAGGDGTSTEFSGSISGVGGLVKTGPGTLTLSGTTTLEGTLTVESGLLLAIGSLPGPVVTVQSGATLGGTGVVGQVGVAEGGTLAPGTSPGLLGTGDLSLASGSTFSVEINGPMPGLEYDRVTVVGAVDLGGATLSISLGYTPTAGTTFVLIDSSGPAAVQGTFAELPEGATFSIDDLDFQVSYVGGDGHDVVLTALAQTSVAVAVAPTPSVFGQSVTLTAVVTAVAPGAGTPAGTVGFYDGTTLLGTATLDGSGVATLTTSALAVGDHDIVISYLGSGGFLASGGSLPGPLTVSRASTVTTVTATPVPSVFGQPVTIVAVVTAVAPGAGTPAGTVGFYDGTTLLGTATLDGAGVATLTTSNLSVGTNTILASYFSDASFLFSGGVLSGGLVVEQASTTVAIAADPSPSLVGQPVTFSAVVVPVAPGAGSPTGVVTLLIDGTAVETVSLVDGEATFAAVHGLAAGDHAVSVEYDGDTNFAGATGELEGGQVVERASTTVVVGSSSNPSVFGQPVTFTAVVSASTPAAGTPCGTVTLILDGSPVQDASLVDGVATFVVSDLAAGTHSVAVAYGGDARFLDSTGTLLGGQVVGRAATTVAVVASPNPSVFGQSTSFTAIVASLNDVVPTGTVEFFDGTRSLGTRTLDADGRASLSTSVLAVGGHTITVVYSGDVGYQPTTSVPVVQGVNRADAALSVTPGSIARVVGQSAAFSVSVVAIAPGAGTPGGLVEVLVDGVRRDTVRLDDTGRTTATLTPAAAGSFTVGFRYLGDGDFAPSATATASLTVGAAATSTQLVASPSAAGVGQPVTLTASVSALSPGAGSPNGTVTFRDGSAVLGTAALADGRATLIVASLGVGSHDITAAYSGGADFINSSSTGVVSIAKDSVTLGLRLSSDRVQFGQPVTYVAIVSPGLGVPGDPTGMVVFLDDGVPFALAPVVGGTASVTLPATAVGAGHAITAAYSGDERFAFATSEAVGLDVERGDVVLSFAAGPVRRRNGLVVNVIPQGSAGLPTPEGTLAFVLGDRVLRRVPLVDGQYRGQFAIRPFFGRRLRVVYGGDALYSPTEAPLTRIPAPVVAARVPGGLRPALALALARRGGL